MPPAIHRSRTQVAAPESEAFLQGGPVGGQIPVRRLGAIHATSNPPKQDEGGGTRIGGFLTRRPRWWPDTGEETGRNSCHQQSTVAGHKWWHQNRRLPYKEAPLVRELSPGSASKCQGRLLKAVVNTGCQHNLISRSCLKHLGLQEVPTSFQNAHPCPSRVVGQVERVEVQFGQEMVQCSALVVDDEMLDFCLGFQTLLSLKTCIDLDEGVLQLKSLGQELPFIHISEEQEK
ncbi:nuclear receptor-interacting protein 2 isoform X2 [Hemicordylus capensis]|uniref:nuclear receptor-interacting protein 2 isoform X2 n=1 Tax=Hemicordylus capensis TaxID=884348 RepID=UPI0023033754|nr:nuclear receptor-interacting protein 2 isoform X2 [Hemicordylus capensis]